MDRISKFRGKDVVTNECVYGFFHFVYIKGRDEKGFVYDEH